RRFGDEADEALSPFLINTNQIFINDRMLQSDITVWDTPRRCRRRENVQLLFSSRFPARSPVYVKSV
ncbi:hypothetical protein PDJAM_G00086900, partial [Pangasius djambal]|nr:hypothetical protein [Pangasius djambal]